MDGGHEPFECLILGELLESFPRMVIYRISNVVKGLLAMHVHISASSGQELRIDLLLD